MHAVVLFLLLCPGSNIFAELPDDEALAKTFRAKAQRIESRIMKLAEFGGNSEGGVSRVAFSEADVQGREYIISLMKEAGLEVRIDAAGNILGLRKGKDATLPPILFGSHIDSVPGGGNYDGDVGVIGALECMQVLYENNFNTRHPLEMVVFSDEEGIFTGSRAMVGRLPPAALEGMSHSGMTITEGIRAIGGEPGALSKASRDKGELKAFLELHIEQGSVLEHEQIEIGVVEGIVGIRSWEVTIEGFANHAGTTPMNKRKDAMLAAARLTIAINRVITSVPGRQVGTVGRIKAEPGAPNVIPGKVIMSLEIRDLDEKKILSLFDKIVEEARSIEPKTGTRISFALPHVTARPSPTDIRIRQSVADAAKELGLSHKLMPSGAGHDAQEIARIAPIGMIFVPSVGGISHSPDEYTRPQAMANGANVLLQTILRIDQGALN